MTPTRKCRNCKRTMFTGRFRNESHYCAECEDREWVDAMANVGGKVNARQDRRMDDIADKREREDA